MSQLSSNSVGVSHLRRVQNDDSTPPVSLPVTLTIHRLSADQTLVYPRRTANNNTIFMNILNTMTSSSSSSNKAALASDIQKSPRLWSSPIGGGKEQKEAQKANAWHNIL